MKSLLAVFILLLSATVFAKSPYEVCNGMFTSGDKVRCMETVKNKQFDPVVTDICDGLFTSNDKITCLNTIADRAYLPEEIKICGSLFTSQDKVSCLSKAGNAVLCPNIQVSKVAVNQILNEIIAGNYRAAYTTANSLLDRYQTCQ